MSDKLDNDVFSPLILEFVCFTASSQPAASSQSVQKDALAVHRMIERELGCKQHWLENISRFSRNELQAALEAIRMNMLRACTIAYMFTTVQGALQALDEKGIFANRKENGICSLNLLLQSPADFWERNASGDFKQQMASKMDMLPEDVQVLIVCSIPTQIGEAERLEVAAAKVHEEWRAQRRQDLLDLGSTTDVGHWRRVKDGEVDSWLATLGTEQQRATHRKCRAQVCLLNMRSICACVYPQATNPAAVAEEGMAAAGPLVNWVNLDVDYAILPESWKEKNRNYANVDDKASETFRISEHVDRLQLLLSATEGEAKYSLARICKYYALEPTELVDARRKLAEVKAGVDGTENEDTAELERTIQCSLSDQHKLAPVQSYEERLEVAAAQTHEEWRAKRRKELAGLGSTQHVSYWRRVNPAEVDSWLASLDAETRATVHRECPAQVQQPLAHMCIHPASRFLFDPLIN